MKASAVVSLTLLLSVVTSGGPLYAQVPEATPTPNPLIYSDPAMNFQAPPGAILVGRRVLSPSSLTRQLTVVAAWALHLGKNDPRLIKVELATFTGSPAEWEGEFESEAHSAGDGVLIRGRKPMTLSNGMPAYFVEISAGAGGEPEGQEPGSGQPITPYETIKEYAVVWADGVRGVALSVSARADDLGAEQAKQVLQDVSAVRYPTDQP